MKRGFLPVIGYCLLVTGLIGCGYTTRSTISNKYKTIYIAPAVNRINFLKEDYVAERYRIYRPLIETEITKAIVDKFIFDGNLKPVDKEKADLILKTEITQFRRDPVRYTDDDDIEEYRLNLVVNMNLFGRRENKILWEETDFTGDVSYFVSGPSAISDDTAVNNAVKDLARRIVERTVEQW